MKHYRLLVLVACLVFGCVARAELVSGVSVVVNDDVITSGEIADKMSPRLAMAARLYSNDRDRFDEEVRKVRAEQLDDLVERKLIMHEFTTTGYQTNVLEAFIDDLVKKNIKRDFYGDRARLIKTLEAEGQTYEMYRRQVREDFIVNWMAYQNVDEPRKTLVSPLKIEQYFKDHQDTFKVEDEVKLRMIVLAEPADGPTAEVRKTADEVVAKVDSGVAFDEMARIYSSGSKRAEGGEYGWIKRTDLKSELSSAAFLLKAGQHSGVIELPEACYIILVEEARPAHVQSLNEVRTDIERTLRSEEKARLHRQWIDRLKKKSFVQFY
jgi:peptidyl-prolyl cis-trans isomerase SurA